MSALWKTASRFEAASLRVGIIAASIFALFVFGAAVARAAVSFDSSGSATTGNTDGTSLSWTHTISGSDRILLVGAVIDQDTTTAITGLTVSNHITTTVTPMVFHGSS